MLSPLRLWAQEPYAVLSEDSTLMTFYYDNLRSVRNGMSVEPFSILNEYHSLLWHVYRENIKNVIFDTSFANCTSLTSTAYWFFECHNLTTIVGIENLNTEHVTNMSCMFYGCSSLTSLDVSHFNTANVTDMGYMFDGCSGLTSLDVSSFNTTNVTDMNSMFYVCSGLTSLDVSHFNTANVKDMSTMFMYCSGLTNLDVSRFNTANVTDMGYMFDGCSGLTSLDVSSFNTTNVTNMSGMFSVCSGLTSLDVSSFNTTNVTDMHSMFYGCSSLASLDLSSFNTVSTTRMHFMFKGCSNLTSLDLNGFNTAHVTDMGYMFDGCSGLMSLDVSSFNTTNVTNMGGMFAGCFGLTSLDISIFNTVNVLDMTKMFEECSAITTIYANDNWSNVNVMSGDGMFIGCTKLIGGNGTAYDASHTDYTYARIDKPGEPGYFTDMNAATETVAVPQFTVEGNRVFIHTATEQAVIYYTLDGSVPNENSTVYTDSIVVDRNCTIKAIAMRENYIPSPVATLEVDWFGVQTDTLILDLAYDGRAVTMTSDNDATIYYTLDGTEPTTRSATYDGKAVMLTGFCTVKAFATAEGKEPTEVMTYVVNSYFDGVTARVREGGSVDEAFQWCGGIGRAEGLAAIVWTCNEPFPQTAATVVRNPNLLLYVNDAKLAPSGITNVVADGRAQQILLTDNLQGDGTHGPAGFHVPQPFHVEGIISYSRTFSQTTGLQGDCRGWETIALPFSVQRFEHETQGECAPFAAGEKDKRSFWLCELTEQGFRDAASLRANTPYIIAMPENEAYARKYRLAGRVTFSASDTDVPATALETAHRGEASFVPCFSHQTASAAIYALNVGEERSGYAAGSVFENSYRDVWPFEAYRTTAQNGVRRLPIADDLSGATGIDNRVEVKDKRYSYYNLQGLPVKAPGKGVYIKGKQKVVFK